MGDRQRLSECRAMVTGASKGLGLLIARQLVEAGARVGLMARESGELRAAQLELGEQAVAAPCDLRDGSAIAAAVEEIAKALGGINLLINNAALVRPAWVSDLAEDDLTVQFETNVLAPIRVTKAALPYLQASPSASIINISSEVAADPRPMLAVYSASKAALEAFSAALRHELRDARIRVAVLRAGRMATGTIQGAWPPGLSDEFYSAGERTGHRWRSGEFMDPSTIARMIVELASLPPDATVHLVEVRGR